MERIDAFLRNAPSSARRVSPEFHTWFSKVGLSATRPAKYEDFGIHRRNPPRLIDRLAAAILGCLVFVPLFMAAQTVSSVDSFQEHRAGAILAFLFFFLVPIGWCVFRHGPR